MAKLSKTVTAIRKRIKRLPKLVNDSMDAFTQKDVKNVIKEYQDGMKKNNFGLDRLTRFSVKRKSQNGYSRPNSPLYGAGESQKNSLYNALSFRRIKNGYRLFRRTAKHYETDLPLNILLKIHENGALIKVTARMRAFLHYIGIHLKKDTKIIRIPPRPIVDKAIVRMLKKKKKDEPTKQVNKAINQLIKTGKDLIFKKLIGIDNETID